MKQLLKKYQIFKNLPQLHIFTKIAIFQVRLNFLDQLLQPYKFHGKAMPGILFFIFASCEPLRVSLK